MVNRFPASAAACLENFLDCPHTAYVHQGWFRSREASEVLAHGDYTQEGVAVEFRNERDAESVVSRLLFPSARQQETSPRGKMLHTDRFLMPTTSRVDYAFGPDRHFIIMSHCVPVTEAETEVYTMMTYRFGPGGRLGPLVRLFFEPLSRRIIRQDVEILRAQGQQIELFGGAQFTSVETDLIGPHLQRLWRQAAGEPELEDAPAVPYTRDARIRF
jgi:phenylpropionate dioxygenase-like ring-hydroxylating dioxygenase large terminal subunit